MPGEISKRKAVSDKALQRLKKKSIPTDTCGEVQHYEPALSLPLNIMGDPIVGGASKLYIIQNICE